MPAKKDVKKTAAVESEKKRPSSESVTETQTVVMNAKDFFAAEDALADETTAEEDASSFQEISECLSQLMNKYHDEAKTTDSSAGNDSKLDALQVDIMLAMMRLRRLNRLSQFRNKKIRDRVAEERQKVEEQYLQLQNLLYEVSHIEKEVEKCLEFKSDHEDIEMVPVEQFYSEAPESISKSAVTKQDVHSQRLARLTWELETRKKLESELQEVEKEKAQFLKQISSAQEQLSTMQPKLESLMEASRPLQEALDMAYDKETVQRQYAVYLPSCLYYLYIQAVAYKEVFDRQFGVNIEGDLDRVKKVIADKRNAGNDDDESDASESEDESNKREVQHHKKTKERRQRRKTETEEFTKQQQSNVLDPFPLHVELKSSYKGKATIYLKFFYIEHLDVIGVKSRLELMADLPRAVASANDLLSDESMLAWLFEQDSGMTCPNPTGALKLDHSKLDLKSKIDVTGRLYDWAQILAGLTFPSRKDNSNRDDENADTNFKQSEATDEPGTSAASGEPRSGQEESVHFFQTVLQHVRKRVIARLSLQEQFAAFESFNVYPPKEVSSWFPARIISRMTQWSSMTFEDFMGHAASNGFRDSVDEEGWFCNVTIERGTAKLTTLIYIHIDYPHTAPLFCFLLNRKDKVYNTEKCSDLWHLSRAVNFECVHALPKSVANYTLCVQLQFLISRLDVVLEVQATEQGEKEFPVEHLFQGLRRGRDRRLPFWFNERRNCYTFEKP